MTGAEIQKTRICNHSEWILAQAVIVEKHYTNITIFTSPALGSANETAKGFSTS
jgi:hypothetical protein